jgi:hypothetical protein
MRLKLSYKDYWILPVTRIQDWRLGSGQTSAKPPFQKPLFVVINFGVDVWSDMSQVSSLGKAIAIYIKYMKHKIVDMI